MTALFNTPMFFFILRQILKGKSLMRALLNYEAREHRLFGVVLDVGGGGNPSYLRFFRKAPDARIITLDMRLSPVDFERDPLPYAEASVEQVVLCNVLEHIYNHTFLMREARRVLKPGGELLGFVPFFMQVHPDPHDYFRYTKEALERIFQAAGFREVSVKELGRGPLAIHLNNLSLFLPRALTLVFLPLWYMFDSILVWLRPHWRMRFPLGYFFVLRK